MSGAASQRGFAGALQVQGRVIGALLMRELHTRFGRENLGYVWLFAEPAMLGFAVTSLHLITEAHLPNGIPPLAFYLIGYIPFYMLRAIINRAASTIDSNRTLLYHRQVTLSDMLVARTLLEGAACLVVTAVATLWSGVVGDGWPEDPMKMVYGIVLMVWWSHGIAMLVAAGSALTELVDRFVHPAVYIFMPLSGAFFMKDWMGPTVAWILWFNPVVQMYEMIRDGQFGERIFTDYDVGYMLAHNVALTLLGLAALRAVRGKLVG
ncbi:ABC transporter permease [Roseomonas sp. NAR14]|uniref:ABC transporter permease n=1 Tax=Roseomonas acroporae TaxID=2937791 RepID=A0A9X1Y950_9PROT|nr:ABC transporter permease [Roseomonas acroporae]MCK8784595.1 ABC transporter permease [Roseomonas acroporae]